MATQITLTEVVALRVEDTRRIRRSLPAGTVNPTVMALAGLVAFVLIAVAVVLRAPLASVTRSYELERERQVFRQQQNDYRQALEQAVRSDLSATTAALERLAVAAMSMESQVQMAIGMPVDAAVAHPPTPIRRAFLASNSFRTAWTDLANAAVSPARLKDLAAVPTAVAVRLAQHTARESDRQELAEVMATVRSLQARIDALDLSVLCASQPLDNQCSTKTIHTTERR